MEHTSPSQDDQQKYRLKPLLKIPVKVWVPVLWSVVLFLVLSMLLPWLLQTRSSLYVKSFPDRTPVFWKGEFIGHTPLKMRITQQKKGKGELRLERKGFETITQELKLSSWSFPLSFLGDCHLEIEIPAILSDEELLQYHLKDLSYWTSQGEARKSRPFPAIFSDFIRDFKKRPELCTSFLREGFIFINNKFFWKDFVLAYRSLFMQDLEHSWESWLLLKKNLALPDTGIFVLYLNAKSLEQKEISKKIGFKELLKQVQQDTKMIAPKQAHFTLPRSLEQFYIKIPSQIVSLSEEERFLPCIESKELLKPADIYVNSFYVSRSPVSKKDLKAFLLAQPYWRTEYRQSLIDKGLADENYLKDDYWLTADEDTPACYVPYYLAKAYADWYSQTYLDQSTLKASLPSSFQWRCLEDRLRPAADSSPFGQWFWLRDPHLSHLQWLRTPTKPYAIAEDFPSWEGEVRPLAKEELYLNHGTCASLPRHWCSPYLSFYLVLEEKEKL